MLTKSFIPLLKVGAQKDIRTGALVVNMSSILGSIKLNHPRMSQGYGGAYPYRSVKTFYIIFGLITPVIALFGQLGLLCSDTAAGRPI